MVIADFDGFVEADAFGLVPVDTLGAIILDMDFVIALGMHIDLFLSFLILEADLVEALALMGLGA
ncbi:MAG TPA: hypothetical protein PLI13_02055, partial [Paracoccus sp. (in: a-proteobacteria)]|nr:hypothetical protein [Paracoccus sp. (in: a-proteobacteria)]